MSKKEKRDKSKALVACKQCQGQIRFFDRVIAMIADMDASGSWKDPELVKVLDRNLAKMAIMFSERAMPESGSTRIAMAHKIAENLCSGFRKEIWASIENSKKDPIFYGVTPLKDALEQFTHVKSALVDAKDKTSETWEPKQSPKKKT